MATQDRNYKRGVAINYNQVKIGSSEADDSGIQDSLSEKTSTDKQISISSTSNEGSKTNTTKGSSETARKSTVKANKAAQVSFTIHIRSGLQGISTGSNC